MSISDASLVERVAELFRSGQAPEALLHLAENAGAVELADLLRFVVEQDCPAARAQRTTVEMASDCRMRLRSELDAKHDELLNEHGDHDILAQARAIVSELPHLEWLSERFEVDSRGEAKDAPLEVAVLGIFSSGKSSLLNALVGADILPVGLVPVTARMTRIAWSDTPSAVVRYADGSARSVDINNLSSVTDQRSDDGALHEVERVEIGLPVEILRDIAFFDTPGFDSGYEKHDLSTERAIDAADAVLWVFNATKAGSDVERAALRHIERCAGKSIGVVNQIDMITPPIQRRPERWERELAGVIANLQRHFPAISRWTPVSAKWIEADHHRSGLSQLWQAIRALGDAREQLKRAARERRLAASMRWASLLLSFRNAEQRELAAARRAFDHRVLELIGQSVHDAREEMAVVQRRSSPAKVLAPAEPLPRLQWDLLAAVWFELGVLTDFANTPHVTLTDVVAERPLGDWLMEVALASTARRPIAGGEAWQEFLQAAGSLDALHVALNDMVGVVLANTLRRLALLPSSETAPLWSSAEAGRDSIVRNAAFLRLIREWPDLVSGASDVEPRFIEPQPWRRLDALPPFETVAASNAFIGRTCEDRWESTIASAVARLQHAYREAELLAVENVLTDARYSGATRWAVRRVYTRFETFPWSRASPKQSIDEFLVPTVAPPGGGGSAFGDLIAACLDDSRPLLELQQRVAAFEPERVGTWSGRRLRAVLEDVEEVFTVSVRDGPLAAVRGLKPLKPAQAFRVRLADRVEAATTRLRFAAAMTIGLLACPTFWLIGSAAIGMSARQCHGAVFVSVFESADWARAIPLSVAWLACGFALLRALWCIPRWGGLSLIMLTLGTVVACTGVSVGAVALSRDRGWVAPYLSFADSYLPPPSNDARLPLFVDLCVSGGADACAAASETVIANSESPASEQVRFWERVCNASRQRRCAEFGALARAAQTASNAQAVPTGVVALASRPQDVPGEVSGETRGEISGADEAAEESVIEGRWDEQALPAAGQHTVALEPLDRLEGVPSLEPVALHRTVAEPASPTCTEDRDCAAGICVDGDCEVVFTDDVWRPGNRWVLVRTEQSGVEERFNSEFRYVREIRDVARHADGSIHIDMAIIGGDNGGRRETFIVRDNCMYHRDAGREQLYWCLPRSADSWVDVDVLGMTSRVAHFVSESGYVTEVAPRLGWVGFHRTRPDRTVSHEVEGVQVGETRLGDWDAVPVTCGWDDRDYGLEPTDWGNAFRSLADGLEGDGSGSEPHQLEVRLPSRGRIRVVSMDERTVVVESDVDPYTVVGVANDLATWTDVESGVEHVVLLTRRPAGWRLYHSSAPGRWHGFTLGTTAETLALRVVPTISSCTLQIQDRRTPGSPVARFLWGEHDIEWTSGSIAAVRF